MFSIDANDYGMSMDFNSKYKSLSEKDKARVVLRLHEQGFKSKYRDKRLKPTLDDALELVRSGEYVDYWFGAAIKMKMADPNTRLYNRDACVSAEWAITYLRNQGEICNEDTTSSMFVYAAVLIGLTVLITRRF